MAEDANMKIVPEDRRAWSRLEIRRIDEKYAKGDKLLQYLPAFLFVLTLIVCAMILWFMFQNISELAGSISQLAGSIAQIGG
jgi:hypothetical protein